MNAVVSFAVGLLFGFGLLASGMSNPAKVLAFLDLAGDWDPSLMLVMAGAIAVGAVAFRVAEARATTLLGAAMSLPARRGIDRRLIAGSLIFGIGWGLAGICPGPALTLLGLGAPQGIAFVLAMLAGMAAYEFTQR